MLHKNIFGDYLKADAEINKVKNEIAEKKAKVDGIENNFGEEVPMSEFYELVEATEIIDGLNRKLDELEEEQKKNKAHIATYAKKHPQIKRISGRPSHEPFLPIGEAKLEVRPTEWNDILIDGDNINIERVKED